MKDVLREVLSHTWFDVLYCVRLRVVEVGVANDCKVQPGYREVLVELAKISAVIGTLSDVSRDELLDYEGNILGHDDATCEYIVG